MNKGYVVKNCTTGALWARDGHVTIYSNIKAARRKASKLNCAVAPKIYDWDAYPVDIRVSDLPGRRYQN